VSPPVGPAGIVECNGDDPDPAKTTSGPRRFRVAAAYSVFATDLVFTSGTDAFVERRAATASFSYRVSDTISVQAGVGATLGGRFVFGQERFSFDPGWIASVAATWKVIGKERNDPFLIAGGAVAASGAATRDARDVTENMYAFDFRASVIGGKTFFDVLSPYLVVRAFGGPILWKLRGEDLSGTDKYHVQVGAGLVVALPAGVDVFAEGVPLGERAAVAGVGYSF
jgi:hypothetical protein